MKKTASRVLMAALVGAVLLAGPATLAKWEPTGDPIERELPRRFLGTVAVMSSQGWQTERVELVIEKWSTTEEREAMFQALDSGGDFALAEVMRNYDAGFVRIGMDPPWRVRSAVIWAVEGGYKVRVATERPINFAEQWVATRSQDYPIGVLELFIRDEGESTGGVLAATQVRVRDGRLEIKGLPGTTGPHRITRVREAKPKN